MPTTTIGGHKIYGGWIRQADVTDSLQGAAPFSFAGYPERRIPIRQCRFVEQFNERPLFIAGLLGKPTSRRVSPQSQFAFTIWFNPDDPLEVAIPLNISGVPSFRQRDPFQLVFLAGYDWNLQQYAKAYYAPRCTAESIVELWDNESQPKKMIGMEVMGRSRAWDFILPDDGNPADPATPVGAYIQFLKTNGGLV